VYRKVDIFSKEMKILQTVSAQKFMGHNFLLNYTYLIFLFDFASHYQFSITLKPNMRRRVEIIGHRCAGELNVAISMGLHHLDNDTFCRFNVIVYSLNV